MDEADREKEHILRVIAASTPEAFWKEFQGKARGVYRDSFQEVKASTRLNDSQRLSLLFQVRHYNMDWLLVDTSNKCGVPASDKALDNGCAYALAGNENVKFTQSYVKKPEVMPTPARFRKQLAAVNQFSVAPVLPLGDVPVPLILPAAINGIVLGTPIGRRFDDEDQDLGTLAFAVPTADYSGWVAVVSFPEILSAYTAAEPREDKVRPILRDVDRKKTGSEE